MEYRLSEKACDSKKPSKEERIQWPTKEMIDFYIKNGNEKHEPFRLSNILTCPDYDYNMNFVLNDGSRTR